jgi:hypothetical protein
MATVAPPWCCRPIGTINRWSMMSLESCLRLTAEILVTWVIFADVTLEFCMDLVMLYATCLQHSLMSVLVAVCRWCLFPANVFGFYQQLLWSHGRRCEVADCLGSEGAMRNYAVQLGVLICRTAALCWTWWSAILAVKFHIPRFQALLWLHVDSVQKPILRVYDEILWL